MIRKWETKEIGPLLALWLESTIHAHPFIKEAYWHESVAVVRDVYLPAASTWVWEEDDEIKGFISVLESRFVGALFVALRLCAGDRPRAGGRGQAALCLAESRGVPKKTYRR
ncbi:putative acetyltransferase [Raoultella terrigena]|uniref:Putative acetyltransferase n=1 Tax=Raoultella terrigena TaxID=577 RepID=A0A485CS25_RAOTE|nr:putative acetyltransferase [Raoultella terrigena]